MSQEKSDFIGDESKIEVDAEKAKEHLYLENKEVPTCPLWLFETDVPRPGGSTAQRVRKIGQLVFLSHGAETIAGRLNGSNLCKKGNTVLFEHFSLQSSCPMVLHVVMTTDSKLDYFCHHKGIP